MNGNCEITILDPGISTRPFAKKVQSDLKLPGEDPHGIVLNQILKFHNDWDDIWGELTCSPIKPGTKLDKFHAPLGKIISERVYTEDGKIVEVKPPLVPSVVFTIRTLSDFEGLLKHRPALTFLGRKYRVYFAEEQIQDFGRSLDTEDEVKVDGSLLLPEPYSSGFVLVLLPHRYLALQGIHLEMIKTNPENP